MGTTTQTARPPRRRFGLFVVALLIVSVAAILLVVGRTGNAAPSADCQSAPAATVGAADHVARTATLVYDATYVHMEVPGLDAWTHDVAATDGGRAAARFVGACDATLTDEGTIASTVPSGARPALAAVRRYALDQWRNRPMTRLLPVVVRRSTVADSPGWSFVLVGPEPGTWRYAVVDDRHSVVAWQLTGQDARRLFDRADGADPA